MHNISSELKVSDNWVPVNNIQAAIQWLVGYLWLLCCSPLIFRTLCVKTLLRRRRRRKKKRTKKKTNKEKKKKRRKKKRVWKKEFEKRDEIIFQ